VFLFGQFSGCFDQILGEEVDHGDELGKSRF
jgi:hypothetical protein